MAIKEWMSLVRFPNLLLIFGSQHLLFHIILKPYLPFESGSLSDFGMTLLALNTVCIAAGGFIINNIFDSKLDSPIAHKNPIPKYLNFSTAWILYVLSILLGLLLTFWLSYNTQRFGSSWINPVMVFLLFLYSWKLKCMAVVGNMAVSLFTSAVLLLVPFAYWPELNHLRTLDFALWAHLLYPFIMLAIFAFLINFIREIIKDIEDIETDAAQQCRSTAVYFGPTAALKIAQLFWVLMILILGLYIYQSIRYEHLFYFILLLALPVVLLSLFLLQPLHKLRINFVSTGLKIFMLTGMLYWIFVK